MATTGTLDAESRRDQLGLMLTRDGVIRLDQAATELAVSAMTIRRDLLDMEADGLLRRVRGGAMPPLGPRSFSERSASRSRAKSIIATKATALVPASGAIALDASTTVGKLAGMIGGKEGLTIVSNSYENFLAARQGGGAATVLIGGEPEALTGSFVGPLACTAASALLYRRFFTSASAVDAAHGSSEVSLAEVQVKHEFAKAAGETVLLADSTKLDQHDVARCFSWSSVSVLITELDPADTRLDAYRELVELR
ncbi:DeoR/GlpR family DNA-binding transcription regulator [Microbacterium sp. NPDC056234]|uniref:DeoR/GlpR family DNA-binding transcription regulator n=1 Tax=Microbacterium sp. NPDC056234 TaxID=3345757 RepID=UPI0035D7B216